MVMNVGKQCYFIGLAHVGASTGCSEKRGFTMGFALSDMTLTSSAFDDGGAIPTRHTGEGEDVSPQMSWSKVPDGTRSFALICHDPDAPLVSPGTYGFVHWVLYGIPGSVTELAEGFDGYVKGTNNFGNAGRPRHAPLLLLAAGTRLGAGPAAGPVDVGVIGEDRAECDRREPPRRHVLEALADRRKSLAG
jgi:phosphatidylethanolamine-binding protein (PEBP) family uncharacterized protein